ncbi:ZIP family metal transporter [Patescibacteria group bacterium]|nr:ZIP family metal transporter [Patescibacteria group bacterium]
MIWFYTIAGVAIVSFISLVGVLFMGIKHEKLQHLLLYLVSFSVGALLGDVFIHILPEIVEEEKFTTLTGFYFLLGLILFFIVEKIIHWHHCHKGGNCSEHKLKPMAYTILVGDGFHNFLDGMIIAGSFLFSVPLGIATTLAVIFHEIPQEIGDFGVLLYSGFSRGKALFWNFISGIFAMAGAILTLLLAGNIEGLSLILLSIAGGGFIYIAGSDLIPELHKGECTGCKAIYQLTAIILGIGVMSLLLFLE